MTLDWFDELPPVAGGADADGRRRRLVELLPDGVLLANARGVHDDATAELALGLTLASFRGIDLAVREARALGHPALTTAAWPTATSSSLASSIGRALA